MNTTPPILLLAYGNPLRGDDSVGWAVGERLAAMFPEDVAQVIVQHQLTPELAEPISRAARVIFIDAEEGAPAGAIRWTELRPAMAPAQPFSHQVKPAGLLVAAQELYGHAPAAHLLTVIGESFGYEERLSPAVERAVGEVIEQIHQFVERGRLEMRE